MWPSARVTDMDICRDIWLSGSSTVFTNNLGTVRVMRDIDSSRHIALTGSPTVFVENCMVHRLGDIDNRLNMTIKGSMDVFIG